MAFSCKCPPLFFGPWISSTYHGCLFRKRRYLAVTFKYSCLASRVMQLLAVRELLDRCTFIVPVLSLPESLQEEVIHWVFRNEDRSAS